MLNHDEMLGSHAFYVYNCLSQISLVRSASMSLFLIRPTFQFAGSASARVFRIGIGWIHLRTLADKFASNRQKKGINGSLFHMFVAFNESTG